MELTQGEKTLAGPAGLGITGKKRGPRLCSRCCHRAAGGGWGAEGQRTLGQTLPGEASHVARLPPDPF